MVVVDTYHNSRVDIVCLEETKLGDPMPTILDSLNYNKNFIFVARDARGTWGEC